MLDKKTALLMACLHRDPASGDWAMRIVSTCRMNCTCACTTLLHVYPARVLCTRTPCVCR